MNEPYLRKGYIFEDPDNDSGYVLTRDVFIGDYIRSDDFKPYGGAPEPVLGEEMPQYLALAISKLKRNLLD